MDDDRENFGSDIYYNTPFVATKEIWGMIWEKGGRRHKSDGPAAIAAAADDNDHDVRHSHT